jgi:O-antigen/teichoic acid export membrane protein
MTLKRNILANYFGMSLVALAPILALPWYLEALGPKQFGLIGFIAMLQAVLGLLDAGMSQALVREIAVRFDSTRDGRHRAAKLLYGFERLYWSFALCAGCITLLLADMIAAHWLKLEGLPVTSGKEAIYGAAIIFAAQFPGSIYRSAMVGAQAQVTLNGIMLSGALLRHIGGVAIVFAWPILPAYLIWQAVVALLETLVRGRSAWSILNVKRNDTQWEIKELRPLWGVVASMSGATWLGALTVQIDKIVLSRMATIEQFGYYVIAATVATGVLQLVYPLVQAVLPHAIGLRAEPAALRRLGIKLTWMIALLAGLVAAIFINAGDWLLSAWLRNPEAATTIYPLMALLLTGTCLNAFFNVGYIYWIVHAKTYRVFQVSALSLVLSLALIPPLVGWKGPIGAAFGWLIINLIGFVLSLEWLKRKQDEG